MENLGRGRVPGNEAIICDHLWENGPFRTNNDLVLCMKIASWVGFERFLNNISTVSRKAYPCLSRWSEVSACSWKPIAPSQK